MLAFGCTIVSLVYLCCVHGTEPENVQIRCCLDEWKEGIQQHVALDSRIYDRVYNAILSDLQAAEQIQYSRERIQKTRIAWWNKAVYAAFLDIYSKFPDQHSKVPTTRSLSTPTPTPLRPLSRVVTENIFLLHQDSHHWTHHALWAKVNFYRTQLLGPLRQRQ